MRSPRERGLSRPLSVWDSSSGDPRPGHSCLCKGSVTSPQRDCSLRSSLPMTAWRPQPGGPVPPVPRSSGSALRPQPLRPPAVGRPRQTTAGMQVSLEGGQARPGLWGLQQHPPHWAPGEVAMPMEMQPQSGGPRMGPRRPRAARPGLSLLHGSQ